MPSRAMRKLTVVGLLAIIALALRPAPSLACSCAYGEPSYDVVFVGRVAAVLEGRWVRKRLSAGDYSVGSTVGLLTVHLMWQGGERPFFAVVGGSTEASCTLVFEPGAVYLIYGQLRGSGPLETNLCLGSRQMDAAEGN